MIIKNNEIIVGQTSDKQKKLIAGDNIQITQDAETGNEVISATGGSSEFIWKQVTKNDVKINDSVSYESDSEGYLDASFYDLLIGSIENDLYNRFGGVDINEIEIKLKQNDTIIETFYPSFEMQRTIFEKPISNYITFKEMSPQSPLIDFDGYIEKQLNNNNNIYINLSLSFNNLTPFTVYTVEVTSNSTTFYYL